MNSDHEPGSRTMSKNRPRNSTESNWAKNRLSSPSAQPVGQQRAQVAPRPPSQLCPALSARVRACCRSPAPHAPRPSLPRARPPRTCKRTPRACKRAPHAVPTRHARAPAYASQRLLTRLAARLAPSHARLLRPAA